MLSMHGRTRLLVSTGMAVCAFDVPVIVLLETAALTAASRIAALWDPAALLAVAGRLARQLCWYPVSRVRILLLDNKGQGEFGMVS